MSDMVTIYVSTVQSIFVLGAVTVLIATFMSPPTA